MLSFFPRGVLDGILNLIESVSEGFSFILLIRARIKKPIHSVGDNILDSGSASHSTHIIRRRDLVLKSDPKDNRSGGSS